MDTPRELPTSTSEKSRRDTRRDNGTKPLPIRVGAWIAKRAATTLIVIVVVAAVGAVAVPKFFPSIVPMVDEDPGPMTGDEPHRYGKAAPEGHEPVAIGYLEWPEGEIVAALYAEHLEANEFSVRLHPGVAYRNHLYDTLGDKPTPMNSNSNLVIDRARWVLDYYDIEATGDPVADAEALRTEGSKHGLSTAKSSDPETDWDLLPSNGSQIDEDDLTIAATLTPVYRTTLDVDTTKLDATLDELTAELDDITLAGLTDAYEDALAKLDQDLLKPGAGDDDTPAVYETRQNTARTIARTWLDANLPR